MKKNYIVASALCALMLNTVAYAHNKSATKLTKSSTEKAIPYPNPQEGFNRHVIYLPHLANEQDAKVELLIGKTINSDCNQQMMAGTFVKKELEGWGYDYFVVKNVGPVASTLMACPNHKKAEKFITINGIDLQRYNSQLPLVIYAPKDIEVKYRIWQASEHIHTAVEHNKGNIAEKN